MSMFSSINESLINAIETDERVRLEQMRRAWDAYWGRLPKQLKTKPGDLDDNVLVNFCGVVVDKGVSFLFGSDLEFELTEGEQTRPETWLEDVWQANRKMTLLQKLGLNGGVTGHAFVKIMERPAGLPRLIVLDPETVNVRFALDDFESVQAYIIRYPAKDPQTGRPVFFRQTIERVSPQAWRIIDEVSNADAFVWRVINEADWRYAFAPVVDGQNLPVPNEFWGASDLEEHIISANQSVNFLLSNLNRIIRFHAHPKTVGTGFVADNLRVGVDETLILPNPEARLFNLEMTNDLSSSIELYKRLREALHEIARIPEVATGRVDSIGALSGVALKVLYQPLLEKTETKRRTYGDLLTELNRRLLAIGGFGDDNITKIHWPDILPDDPMESRQTALIDKQLGVSNDTLLRQLGYDPDVEREKATADASAMAERMLTAFDRGEGEESGE